VASNGRSEDGKTMTAGSYAPIGTKPAEPAEAVEPVTEQCSAKCRCADFKRCGMTTTHQPTILSAPTISSVLPTPCTTRCQQAEARRCRCSCHGARHGTSKVDPDALDQIEGVHTMDVLGPTPHLGQGVSLIMTPRAFCDQCDDERSETLISSDEMPFTVDDVGTTDRIVIERPRSSRPREEGSGPLSRRRESDSGGDPR